VRRKAIDPIGIFAVDPGGHTGIAWGIFDQRQPLVKDAMLDRQASDSETIAGDEAEQLAQLVEIWDVFNDKCAKLKIPVDLVIEDFSLLPKAHKPGKEGISPVRYAWVFVGYLWGREQTNTPEVHWQLPGVGLRYNTRQMLVNWDCWVKGRDHERAAYAHIGARLMRIYALRAKGAR
jgi:hypothetical protein